MDSLERYNRWLGDAYIDERTKEELRAISDDEKEINERFYTNLSFGTGGLRGILGAGTNRMNIYTVRMATQGLANYILKEAPVSPSVVIAYDCRRMSSEFAREAALVFNGNGIKAYVFDELRPTPELSFAIRYLGCTAGIVITASHNPPEYNGYKVYWDDGGQTTYPRDEDIIGEVNSITGFDQIKTADAEKALKDGLYNTVGKEIDDEYVKNVKAQMINPDIIKDSGLTIVYTPLHGTGNKPVRRVLSEVGFSGVYVVPEQELPDSEFSTVKSPNPEDPKAFVLAMELGEKLGADILIGTDPDADRVGAVVKNAEGAYTVLTGNMTGILLTEYMLSQKRLKGELPENGAVVSTIVSTDLTKKIAAEYGCAYIDVLTGFKYIGEKMREFDEDGSGTFLFGFEESYGALAGTYARDKDAVVCTMLICEAAAYYKRRGMSLYEGLQEIYGKYGYYKESIESLTLAGIEGIERIGAIMASLREAPPEKIGGLEVVETRDYKSGICKKANEPPEKITLPNSDVLYYVLSDGSWFCVRPSGTEPKIKIYFGVVGADYAGAEKKNKELAGQVMELIR